MIVDAFRRTHADAHARTHANARDPVQQTSPEESLFLLEELLLSL